MSEDSSNAATASVNLINLTIKTPKDKENVSIDGDAAVKEVNYMKTTTTTNECFI